MLDTFIQTIEEAFNHPESGMDAAHQAFAQFLEKLESGQVRSAAPGDDGSWNCDLRVKKLILFGFRLGRLETHELGDFQFCDKHNLWPSMQNLAERRVRIVPGGTTVRRGACLKSGVTVMPPAYVNIGAFIDEGTMIDSHALVGSCAQIGKHCHISAAAQIGGVIEPVGALPVIIEDNCFIGGNCGFYESAHIHANDVLASGTILTRSTPVFDLVHDDIIRPIDGVLHIPQNAVVVPGSRALKSDFARQNGLSAYAPLIIKYRDDKTDTSLVLEELLR
jgi:2,3,4,5-tetrahydropyridine-2-carboxylate N-succinyltransferase